MVESISAATFFDFLVTNHGTVLDVIIDNDDHCLAMQTGCVIVPFPVEAHQAFEEIDVFAFICKSDYDTVL